MSETFKLGEFYFWCSEALKENSEQLEERYKYCAYDDMIKLLVENKLALKITKPYNLEELQNKINKEYPLIDEQEQYDYVFEQIVLANHSLIKIFDLEKASHYLKSIVKQFL